MRRYALDTLAKAGGHASRAVMALARGAALYAHLSHKIVYVVLQAACLSAPDDDARSSV